MRRPLASVPLIVALGRLVAPTDLALITRALGQYRLVVGSLTCLVSAASTTRSAHLPSVPGTTHGA